MSPIVGYVLPQVEAAHFRYHPKERRIVEPFLFGFAVTHGAKVSRGGDEVSAYYLKADPEMQELLGLERELLLIYAPYPDLQARTIELHDFVMSSNPTRLDPMGSVIVADASNTRALIKDVLMREPHRPPIVALRTEDLGRIDTLDALRRSFIEQFFQRDLFGLESPITKDSLYFGRTQLTTELFDRARSGQNSGLFGLRRMGKTSVLLAVGRRLTAAAEGAFTYIFLQDPSRYKLRWRDLLRQIVRQTAEQLPPERVEISRVFGIHKTYSEELAAERFRNDMTALLDIAPGGRILLGLDELEAISFDLSFSDHWNTDYLPFWQALRSLHQESRGRFGFLVAGINPQPLERHQVGRQDNPLFETARLYYLPPFERDDLEAMVGTLARLMGLQVDIPLYGDLFSEFGGHPFLTRRACSVATARLARPGVLTVDYYREQSRQVDLEVDRAVTQILSVLGTWYPEEFELIRQLSHGDLGSFLQATQASSALTQHLEGYGLIADARTEPTITIGAVRRHLARVPSPPQTAAASLDDPEAVQLEIGRRRNPIEKALRRTIADGLKFAYGPVKCAHQAMQCWPEQRRIALERYGYDELWDHTYFDELVKVVDKEWDAFQQFFSTDKPKVLNWLEHVNRSRVDAHAKTLAQEDWEYLRTCFLRLEEALGLTQVSAR
jgi:hypothetical protein